MNLSAFVHRPAPIALQAVARKGPTGTGYGGGSFSYPLGAAYSDTWKLDRAPTSRELISQLVGVAYACVNLNSNAVASNPIQLYVRTGKGQPKTRFWHTEPVTQKTLRKLQTQKSTAVYASNGAVIEEVKEHPLLTLLDIGMSAAQVDTDDYTDNRPALSGYHLFKMTQVYLESIGRAYWLIEKDGLGVPTKVWLLRSHLCKEVFDPNGSGKLLFLEYGGPTGIRYDPSQILRFADPDANSLYSGGYSPLCAAIEKIRIYRKQDAHINAILENSARPDALFSPQGTADGFAPIGPAEARRIEVAINQKFREAGTGSIMVSPVPGALQVLGWKPGDIVELERAKMLKSEIGFIFGVPDSLIERNPANQAGAKTADYAHAKYAVMPRLANIVSTLRTLLRMFDDTGRMFLDWASPLPEDNVFALEQTRVGATTGAITVDEIRMAMELEPYGDAAGSVRYINNQLVAIGRDGIPIPAQSPTQAPAQPIPDTTDPQTGQDRPVDLPEPKPPSGKPGKSITDRLRAAGYTDDQIQRPRPAKRTPHANASL